MMDDANLSLDGFMAAQAEEFAAQRGEKLPEGSALASEEAVIEALRQVYDPEIPVNIYDLGLIYKCAMNERGDLDIEMTLTAPGCPVAAQMPGWVADAVSAVPGTGEVEVRLVWDPPWTKDRMSEDAKLALGLF
jgi:FeS assembly SUF system protein